MDVTIDCKAIENFSVPHIEQLLELDPYLKEFEDDIKKRWLYRAYYVL